MSKNLQQRYWQHKNGYSKYTKQFRGNIILVYLEVFEGLSKREGFKMALRREKEIKKWSREKIDKIIKIKREKINALIRKYMGVSQLHV